MASGLANLIALLGLRAAWRGSRTRRAGAALVAGAAAAVVWDEAGQGRRWFRRALLPHRPTWNVLAHAGDPGAEQTIVFIAHHDAAHSGLVFHPALGRIGPRLFPRMHERATHTLPIIYAVWLGPVLSAPARCWRPPSSGSCAAAGGSRVQRRNCARDGDIGARRSVPGANDNLTAVAVLAGLAEALEVEPAPGVRVLLLSTGSEESFSEGMHAFLARHRRELSPATTEFVCLECLGGPTLIVLEGEGMLRMRSYDTRLRDELAASAAAAGVGIHGACRRLSRPTPCRPARWLSRGHARVPGPHQAAAQLPLAQRRARAPALVHDRGRPRGVRAARAEPLTSAASRRAARGKQARHGRASRGPRLRKGHGACCLREAPGCGRSRGAQAGAACAARAFLSPRLAMKPLAAAAASCWPARESRLCVGRVGAVLSHPVYWRVSRPISLAS